VVAQLLQTSKKLQAAAATVWAGQQQVVLHTGQVQQAKSFAQWLSKHAGLLRSIDLQLERSIKHGATRDWEATTLAALLAGALQQAAQQDFLQALCCFSYKGDAASAGALQALTAVQLTQLAVELRVDDLPAISAVTALTSLRS
jgi:phosphoribosylformimino-5-aminoimidazole carboxamide ribonucleotide (ProFAR) isomerase